MAKKLEKVLELLINEQKDEARSMLHDWFVESARKINQELIAEDDYAFDDERLEDGEDFDVEDAFDEIESEEFFSESEDDEEDLDLDDAEEELEGDLEVADEVEDDAGVEDKVDELEAELEALKAEFEKIQSELAGEVEDLEDEDLEGEDLDDLSDDELAGEEEVEDFDSEELELDEDFDDIMDEDFDDLEESIIDELSKVAVDNAHGEAGAGKKFAAHDESPMPQRSTKDRKGGKPVEVKSENHKGYEREAVPATVRGTGAKSPRNVMDKAATKDLDKSDCEGDLLKNEVSGNDDSVISGKMGV